MGTSSLAPNIRQSAIDRSMCVVVSRKCKSGWIISWKLRESKTEHIFSHNMGTNGWGCIPCICGHISHTPPLPWGCTLFAYRRLSSLIIGLIGAQKMKVSGFHGLKFFECGSDFFDGRFRYPKCKICANSAKWRVEIDQQLVRDFVPLRFAFNGFELADYQ